MGICEFRGLLSCGMPIAVERSTDTALTGNPDAIFTAICASEEEGEEWVIGSVAAVLDREFPPRISVENESGERAAFLPVAHYWQVTLTEVGDKTKSCGAMRPRSSIPNSVQERRGPAEDAPT